MNRRHYIHQSPIMILQYIVAKIERDPLAQLPITFTEKPFVCNSYSSKNSKE